MYIISVKMKVVFALTCLVAFAAAGVVIPPGFEGRITNGTIAERNQFPYQAGLSLDLGGGKSAWCGGTLVSNRCVVTAAHCTADIVGVTVYLGAFNIKDDKEVGQQRIYVGKEGIFTHENYDAATITNDIAVIKFPSEVVFNKYIQPAVLPKYSSSNSYSTYVGDDVVASGWGKDSDSATSVSPILNYVYSTVITQTVCNRYYLGSIKPSMICITTKQTGSTCNGDSGGPLVYKENGKDVLIGATSFGIALGCEVNWPGVFTRITSYLDWIGAKTGIVEKQ